MTNELGPGERPSTFLVGEPDSSGTTLSISEAARRTGISISTLRRRLSKGQVVGAHKAPGPDGEEWRIPVASLDSIEPSAKDKRPKPDEDELHELRKKLAETELRAAIAEGLLDSERRGREELAAANAQLSADAATFRLTIEGLTRALPPAPSSPIEQTSTDRRWFRKKAPKPTP